MLKDRIEDKLRQILKPTKLVVIDESHKHVSHGNYKPGGESHFYIQIVSPLFKEMTRLERHRRVYEILEDEIKGGVHALRLDLAFPGELNGSE